MKPVKLKNTTMKSMMKPTTMPSTVKMVSLDKRAHPLTRFNHSNLTPLKACYTFLFREAMRTVNSTSKNTKKLDM